MNELNGSHTKTIDFDSRRRFLQKAMTIAVGLTGGLGTLRLHAADWLRPGSLRLTPRIPTRGSRLVQTENPGLGLILGPGMSLRPDGSPSHYISIVDLDALGDQDYVLNRIPMTFFGHGIVPNPIHPERASVFQKKGPSACEVDIKSLEVLRPIETVANRKFYGHGAYSPDGSLLYSTETVLDTDFTGVIAVRDAVSHQVLGEFPTFGSAPHDCQLIDDGKTMAITNGGGPLGGAVPSVTYVDMQSEKLIDRLEFGSPLINAGHLAVSASGDLAVVSAQREGLKPRSSIGGISLRPNGGQLRTMSKPGDVTSQLIGETLSVCIDEHHGVVAATTPLANSLTFWDMASTKFLQHISAVNPRGVALTQNGRFFIVSYGKPPQISLLSSDSLTKAANPDLQLTGMSGSHILSYNLPPELRA